MATHQRPGLREAKKQEVRQAIVAAAMGLFEDRGFEATTMDDIAHRAHVSRPTVFNYFSNKEALLPAAINQMLGDRLEALEAVAAGSSRRRPLEVMRQFVVGIGQAYAQNPETARAFFVHHIQAGKAHRNAHCEPESEGFEARKRLDRHMSALIAKAQASGEIRSDFEPTELVRLVFVGLFASTIGPWLWGRLGDRPLPEVVSRHFDFFIDGLVGPR